MELLNVLLQAGLFRKELVTKLAGESLLLVTRLQVHLEVIQEQIVTKYRVTIPLVQNLPLTSKQTFRFGLGRIGQARPKRNFCFEVNGKF